MLDGREEVRRWREIRVVLLRKMFGVLKIDEGGGKERGKG